VNPSASLNDWLVFPSSQELEVLFMLQSYFIVATLVLHLCYFYAHLVATDLYLLIIDYLFVFWCCNFCICFYAPILYMNCYNT
jgi:hypothetical protein